MEVNKFQSLVIYNIWVSEFDAEFGASTVRIGWYGLGCFCLGGVFVAMLRL